MRHDPERDAAAYVGGVMRARRTRRFEAHLLACDDCWHEVSEGRLGRAIAESARELAPQDLRERIRASIAAAPPPRARDAFRPALAFAVALVVVGSVVTLSVRTPGQPAAIRAAVTDFLEGRMVADAAPRTRAPDLGGSAFELAHTGSGWLKDVAVDAFMFEDDAGRRMLVYRSVEPFPVATGATLAPGGESWRAIVDGVALLCTSEPHALLVLADDALALDEAARAMDLRA